MASGVPILEALQITRETSGNAVFEKLFSKVHDAIREGETISQPLKDYAKPGFHPVALFFWIMFVGAFIAAPVAALLYMLKLNSRVVDDMVVNMVTSARDGRIGHDALQGGYHDEEVVATEGLMALMEPLLIIPGVAVGFTVTRCFCR